MTLASSPDSTRIDQLDRDILHALQISPRAGFAVLAQVLAVSEQTVARRYARLRRAGVVRVIGLVDPSRIGQLDWMLRVSCRPHAALPLAQALATRADVSWVSLTGGGADILASIRARSADERDELLLGRLPRTAQVLSMTAAVVLSRFGHENDAWVRYGSTLSDSTVAELFAGSPHRQPIGSGEGERLGPADQPLIDALGVDGRASIAALAAVTGWTHGRTSRRLDVLLASGTLYLDVDLAVELLGYPVLAMLWLNVEPGQWDQIGMALAAQPEVSYAAATTGPSNVAASLSVRDVRELYSFTSSLGNLSAGIRGLQIEPVVRRIKQAGSVLEGSRLQMPTLPPVWR